ncbi:MAG TPA: hypothetical protein VFU94_03880 [Conexibacter sp.]|nr:hypothetical protein [Conexibacter sp.]
MSEQSNELGYVSRLAVALCELTLSTLPWRVPDTRGGYADWRILAPALLGHATLTTRTIMDLQPPQHLQAQILARSSMEAAILFAWLAASPEDRVATWWEESLARRSVTVEKRNDLLSRSRYAEDEAAAAALSTPDWLPEDDALEQRLLRDGKAIRAERRAGRKSALPPLEQQAGQADLHWMEHMRAKGLGLPLQAFSVVYRTIYERGHDATHSRAGLVAALLARDSAGQAYCGLPPRPPHPGELPYEAAGGACIDMVCIAAEAVGLPSWSQVIAVMQQHGPSPE